MVDNIVVLTVPEGTHKPYSCPTGFYLRSGPNSQKLDRDSIVEFFQSEGRVRYDEMVRDDLPIDERFDDAAYKRYYFEKGSRVMVEVFDDRVDVVSPGGVCKGITRENFGTVTITRNPIIASMFFRIDYIEQMGTGIGRMRDAARKANVAEPAFEFDGFFKVTFKRNIADATNPSSDSQAVASGNQAVATADRKNEILTFIKTNGKTSSSELAKVTGLTSGRIRSLLRELVNEGTIEKIGDNRFARYILKR